MLDGPFDFVLVIRSRPHPGFPRSWCDGEMARLADAKGHTETVYSATKNGAAVISKVDFSGQVSGVEVVESRCGAVG